MKAPSEKHLQDYIWQHHHTADINEEPFDWYSLVGREVSLPSGYADFIGLGCPTFHGLPRNALVIVETKKDAVNRHTLTQILRYIRDVNTIWQYAIAGMPDITAYGNYTADLPSVMGVMIGSSVSDEVLIAAEAAQISVLTYDFDGTVYTFEPAISPKLPKSEYLSFHDSPIADVIRGLYGSSVQDELKRHPEREYPNEISLNDYWRFFTAHQNRISAEADDE